ncbi:MAG: tRNA lysidine(34) synthetase TilS [Clostridia bacterium]|nr:tRNA lysidine(34) synthetase TilS [Clostridia bacterium]
MINLTKFSGKKICVAVSGGVDSMALLHYLSAQQAEGGYRLAVAHCEHGIRGEESLADGLFVQETCKRLGLECFFFAEDCPRLAKERKMSLETAARAFRYECFAKLLAEGKADVIATAHHQGDEAETVLFRIARGAALSGASGISPENDRFIRPFLEWSRREIEAYAAEEGIEYREDKTNFDVEYTRNKIRLEVLPKLEEAVPGAAANIARFALRAAEDDRLLYEMSEKLISAVEDIGDEAWQVEFCREKPLFTRACLTVLKWLGLEKDYTAAHLTALYDLQFLQRGARVSLPKKIEVERRENSVAFSLKNEENFVAKNEGVLFSENGFDGGRYAVSVFFNLDDEPANEVVTTAENGQKTEWIATGKIVYFDLDKLPKDAVFRFRKEGDEIRRFGGGTKSLKKFFNERKTPAKERAYLPLIAEKGGSEVYVVCGEEISEKIKVSEGTLRVAYILLQKKKGE